MPGVVFYRKSGGKIVEFCGMFDTTSMMQQVGVIEGQDALNT